MREFRKAGAARAGCRPGGFAGTAIHSSRMGHRKLKTEPVLYHQKQKPPNRGFDLDRRGLSRHEVALARGHELRL